MKLLAKTFEGLEEVLTDELKDIGATAIKPVRRGVMFEGDKRLLYESNYRCYTALRILMPIAEFRISDQQGLYNFITEIPWEKYISLQQTFAIDAVVFSKLFPNSHFAALRCKDAIADHFLKKFRKRPNVSRERPDILVNLHMKEENVTVSLDSSGSSLHLRGYRKKSHEAPLSEVLAAGMIKLTGWDASSDFYDPLCGSGTLLIEAAMQAMNIPAGYYREKFGFMNWSDYDEGIWRDIKKKTSAMKQQPGCNFYGSDISERAITASRLNIRIAGLASVIKLKAQDVRESSPRGKTGIMITNPPYGERMKTEDLNGFYKELGDALKKNYSGFSAWLLTSDREALKHVGLRTTKKIILFNGPLECRFANFGLYKGSRK